MTRHTRTGTRVRTAIAAAVVAALAPAWGFAQDVGAGDISEETVEYFRINCASCHTVGGGKLAGPDLKGVTERRDRAWLTKFMLDPKGVIDSGDPIGQELLREANGVYMPPVPGMTRDRAEKLMDLVAYESGREKSRFAGTEISDRPLTPADLQRGERLFNGTAAFASGAPSCLSCHNVADSPGLGGGRLGPDLTDAYARLEGRKALAAWLSAPPSVTMQPIYKKHPLEGDEVLALVAYMKSNSENGHAGDSPGPLGFLIAGVGGVLVALIGFDLVWRRRFRGVRRTLVQRSRL